MRASTVGLAIAQLRCGADAGKRCIGDGLHGLQEALQVQRCPSVPRMLPIRSPATHAVGGEVDLDQRLRINLFDGFCDDTDAVAAGHGGEGQFKHGESLRW